MAGSSFSGRRLGLSLAAFALACGSGGSIDGGFIGVPWKTPAQPPPPPFADSATTTALATGGPAPPIQPVTGKLKRKGVRASSARAEVRGVPG